MNIDFHAHVLPGADHGSANSDMSLKQLALAKQAGIDLVIATPHFYPNIESISEFLSRRKESSRQLNTVLDGKDLPQVRIGAEVQLQKGLEHIDGLEQLCIEGTNTLLLELPRNFSIRSFDQTLDSLLYGRSFTVVLAHIDRYDPIHVDFLLDFGCLGQLNADSLCHFRTARRSMRWAQSDSVIALGSDIHGLDEGYASFLKAKKKLGAEYAALMQRTESVLK